MCSWVLLNKFAFLESTVFTSTSYSSLLSYVWLVELIPFRLYNELPNNGPLIRTPESLLYGGRAGTGIIVLLKHSWRSLSNKISVGTWPHKFWHFVYGSIFSKFRQCNIVHDFCHQVLLGMRFPDLVQSTKSCKNSILVVKLTTLPSSLADALKH